MKQKAIFLFACVLLLSSIAFADYLDAYAKGLVQTNSSVYIKGYVKNSTGGSVANVNVTANLSGSSSYSVSASDGYFDINVTSSVLVGEYNISVTTNTSLSKSIRIYASNVTSGLINFTGAKPPYSTGRTFLINISMKNGSGSLIENYTPTVNIYTANGPRVSWNVTNATHSGNHSGYITYNISVPSDADGTYTISVDRGNINTVVLIRSNYLMAVNTQTSNNETKTDFSPGSNFTIVAKIRDNDGNPIGYAVNVSARVTMPNGTVNTVALANDTTREGHYVSSVYVTDGSLRGRYTIDVYAIVSGRKLESSSIVNTESIKARLEKQAEFFKEWGDSAAFTAGGTVGMNVIVSNLSDDSVFTGTVGGLGSNTVNCTNGGTSSNGGTNITGLYASNGSTLSIGTVTYDAGGMYMGQGICRITFIAPSTAGNYKITFNTSVGNINVSGSGYFEVQKYILKANPVSSLGGAFDFAIMLYPGDNATFEISAYDLNTQAEITGNNIFNLTVTKIIPLDFVGGSSDITEGPPGRSDVFNTTNYTIGSSSVNPTITISLPVNRTGPFQAEIRAIINNGTTNETVTGRAFYLSKYVMGFLSSFGGMMGGPLGGGEGGGGPSGGMESGPSGGFGGSSACSGTENFRGNVKEIKTNTAPKDPVTFNNILEAREEMTGKSVLSCLSMTLNSSDSSGNVQVPVSFNISRPGCSSITGFYFMLVNITYQGRSDAVPAGFNCKRLSFWPSVSDNTGTFAWRFAPTSSLILQVSSARRINDSTTIRNGTIQVLRAFNFNPGSGMRMLAPNGTLTARINISTASANITLTPSNFSLSSWPSGFISISVQVTGGANYSNIADSGESGFQVTPFDINTMQLNGEYNMWGQTLNAGQNISITVEASTNVSRSNYNLARANTTSGFTARVGIPWEGKMKSVSVYNATLQTDGWDGPQSSTWPNFGKERWVINISLPSNMKKGFNMIEITVNNSNNEKATTEIGFQAAAYSVKVAQEEGLNTQNVIFPYTQSADNATLVSYGFNLTTLNSYQVRSQSGTACIGTGLNMTRWNEGQSVNHWYGSNVTFLVLDNGTANVYSVIVLNRTGAANYTILLEGQNITAANSSSPLYLWKIDSCGYSKWINASAAPSGMGGSWGGSWQKGSNFTIPYLVQKSSVAISGAAVSINAIIKQQDSAASGGASSGGFGFDRKLTSSDYASSSVNTDANGVAFVPLNVSGTSGSMMVFWKLIDGSVQDVASFQGMGPGGDSGTQIQIRNFDTWGDRIKRVRSAHATAVVTLYNFTSGTVWSYSYGAPTAQIYNGSYNETISGVLTNDGTNKTYYFLLNSTSTPDLFAIDTDMDFTGVQVSNKNNSFSIDSESIAIAEIRQTGNGTSRTAIALYRDGSEWYPINTASQNITVRVCAMSFAKPSVSYPGASVYIYAESWSMGSPMSTSTTLNWYDSINGTKYTFGANNATTGPKGCAVIDVSHPTGWPANSPVNIKATVTYGGNSESTWVDNVWRPSQCSNMIDDDGDTKTDYSNWWGSPDAQCSSNMDDDESS